MEGHRVPIFMQGLTAGPKLSDWSPQAANKCLDTINLNHMGVYKKRRDPHIDPQMVGFLYDKDPSKVPHCRKPQKEGHVKYPTALPSEVPCSRASFRSSFPECPLQHLHHG